MDILSPDEHQKIQHLMEVSLAHATAAFSQFAHRLVICNGLRWTISKVDRPNIRSVLGNMSVVITDMLGEVDGRSYFLLSEKEKLALQRICITMPLTQQEQEVMGREFIKEIGNILTAATVTKLSDALKVSVFGGVPQLMELPGGAMVQKIREDFEPGGSSEYLLMSARFVFSNYSELQPLFFWKFAPDFLGHIKIYSGNT